MAFCRSCTKEIGDMAAQCPHCGAQQLTSAGSSAAVRNEPKALTWYVEVLKKYAVFNGRARRKEYWMFTLFSTLITIAIVVVDSVIGTKGILSNLYTVAVLLPTTGVAIRRMHDTDRSGWWILCPVANIIFLIMDGTPGTNRYGPSPK